MGGVALDLATALDPVLLAGAAGLVPDPWQARVLRSTAGRLLLNCSRQSGKSTVTALLAVHQAVYVPGSLALLLSPSQRQSGELFRRCLHVYRALDRPVPAEAETALRLELENGSRIVSLPGKEGTIRGYSGVALLAIDEAARVTNDLYAAVRPMLAVSGGRLVALSTPFGNRGWWYEAWRAAGEPWECNGLATGVVRGTERYQVPATDCPRISPAFLAEEERTLGAWWFGQEYGCQFLDAQTAAFRLQDVERAMPAEGVEQWAV